MNSYIKNALLFLQDIIFTVKCPYCEKVIDRNDYACKECKSKFPQKGYETYAVGGYKTIAPFKYDGIFASGVKNFKFYENPSYSRQLAIPLANEIIAKYGVGCFDIITTGNTLGECCKVLKKAGCKNICCAALCAAIE